MEIEQIRAFLMVADELHFGRAAERLHIAQPPLSRIIKALERELNTTLFDRTTRSVKLTESGKALVTPAQEILETQRRARTAVRAADSGEAGVVRIAFAGVSTHRLVARLARVIHAQRPGIELELSSQNFAQPAMSKLLDEEADLVLGRWDLAPPGISLRVAMPDSLVVAIADTHPLAGATRVSMTELTDEKFVSLAPHEGAVLPDRLRRLSFGNGFVANVVQIAPDTQTALALVGAEVGCHLTLASVAHNVTDPHVIFLPLTDTAPDVHLRAAWRTEDKNPALHAVLSEVELVAAAASPTPSTPPSPTRAPATRTP